MIASTLALLSTAVLASAAGLKSTATQTPTEGQAGGNWTLQESEHGYSLAGSQPIDLTISATVEDGELKMLCPYQLTAVLIPAEGASYTVEFVNATDGLPEGTVTGGWNTTDDRRGIPEYDEAFTKVINSVRGFVRVESAAMLTVILDRAGQIRSRAWRRPQRAHLVQPVRHRAGLHRVVPCSRQRAGR